MSQTSTDSPMTITNISTVMERVMVVSQKIPPWSIKSHGLPQETDLGHTRK